MFLVSNRRILVIDDNENVHESMRKILIGHVEESSLDDLERKLLGHAPVPKQEMEFVLDFASQGEDGLKKVLDARNNGLPYALVFVDVRMPPGIDGVETLARLWKIDPDAQGVICTAYSDYSWDEIVERVGYSDRMLVLKKPFENMEVLQLACALTEKWNMTHQARLCLKDLEEMVQARTRDIAQANEHLRMEMDGRLRLEEQVRQARRMEVFGQISSGVAHHFNNALQVMQIHAEFLAAERPDDPEVAANVKKIRDAVAYASSIVKELLAFSQKQLMRPEPVDLNAFIGENAAEVREALGPSCFLTMELTPGLPSIHVDSSLLRQALINLARNARDAMRDGGPFILRTQPVQPDPGHYERHPSARKGTHVCLVVQDCGCGMEEHIQQKIFDPFFTTKHEGMGMGLGLSTVYGVVKQHQGWIELESRQGVGTTFRLVFPPATS